MNAVNKELVDQALTEAGAEQFIQQLGQRALEARKAAKLSRRQLSEKSGVSQRTIVLLETGKGNISVALLFRVAAALDLDIAALVVGGQSELTGRLMTRFNQAAPAVQEQILSLLLPEQLIARKRRRICLIGLRGAGKSTLGKLLSNALSIPFYELNREIESIGGMSVAELMSLYGQEGYRRLELQALQQLAELEGPLLVAAAGGVVSESDNYQLLLKNFCTVWLKATPEEHMARVIKQGDTRLIPRASAAPMAELKSILTSREALYAEADFVIDTSNSAVDDVLVKLLDIFDQPQTQ